MQIVIDIPEEYEEDFNEDKFKDCLKRTLMDCKAWNYDGLTGEYEHQTLNMFIDALETCVVLPKHHGRLIDAEYFLEEVGAPTIVEADMAESKE